MGRKNIRLLILTPTYLPRKGGIEEAIFHLSNNLSKNYNVDVSIVTPFINNILKKFEIQEGGIKIYRFCRAYAIVQNKFVKFLLCNIFTLFYVIYLYIFRNLRFDIINTHTVALMGIPSVLLSKIFKKPLIFTVHHYGSGMDISHPKENGFLLNMIIKLALKFSDHVVVTSKSQEAFLKYLFGDNLSNMRYSIIPFGACVRSLKKERIINLNEYEGKFIIFTIGRLVKRKRYDILVEIAEKLKDKKDIIFLIAGEGPERDNLIELINKKGLKNIRLLGKISDEEKSYWFLKANLYIQCSEYEGFGISYIEALLHGLPVLAYKNEAIEEIKENIKEGVFIFDSVKDAVDLLLFLRENYNRIDKERIISKVLKIYSWDIISKKYYKLFKKLIISYTKSYTKIIRGNNEKN